MNRFVTFSLGAGRTFVAEVDDSLPVAKTTRGLGAQEELVGASNKAIEAALQNVKYAAETVVDKFRTLAQPPEELTLELGIKLSAEAGAVIAKTSADASFTVTMKWKRPSAAGA